LKKYGLHTTIKQKWFLLVEPKGVPGGLRAVGPLGDIAPVNGGGRQVAERIRGTRRLAEALKLTDEPVPVSGRSHLEILRHRV
jgi:hypothetical protein